MSVTGEVAANSSSIPVSSPFSSIPIEAPTG